MAGTSNAATVHMSNASCARQCKRRRSLDVGLYLMVEQLSANIDSVSASRGQLLEMSARAVDIRAVTYGDAA